MPRKKKASGRALVRRLLALHRDIPPAALRAEIHARVSREWDVVGTYFGFKHSHGRWTRVPSLVCIVREKQPRNRILRGRLIPKTLNWIERKRKFVIRTDVVESPADIQLQQGPILGPGDTAQFAGDFATIGAVLDHPVFGRCATTAGHLFHGTAGIGQSVQLSSGAHAIAALVHQSIQELAVDYALVKPTVDCDSDNLFQDRARIGPVFNPSVSDINRRAFVLDGAGAVRTVVRGIHAKLNTPFGLFDDVILTDAVTRGGMSGAALVDTSSRLWGFLLGTLGRFSLFMPADRLLQREFAALA